MAATQNRRERRRDKTRQALLDVAIQLIAERGIYAARVEDITERSDLGKGAFYNYFESKDRLVAELVSQGIEILHRKYFSEPIAAASRTERIAAVIAAHDAFFADHPAYVVLFHQARGLAKVKTGGHESLASVFVEYLRRTGEAIAGPDGRDGLTDDDLIDVAAMVLGATAGYRSFRVAAGLERGSTTVADALVAGIPAVLAARARGAGGSTE